MNHFFFQLHFSLPWFITGVLFGATITSLLFVTIGKKIAKKASERIDTAIRINHELNKMIK